MRSLRKSRNRKRRAASANRNGIANLACTIKKHDLASDRARSGGGNGRSESYVLPTPEGFSEEITAVEVVASTTCPMPDEVAGANVASPLYMQKIEWVPGASDVVVKLAFPCAVRATAGPSALPLSRNVTVPVGVPGVVEVTVAVNVTDCPMVEGFTEEVIVARVAPPADAVAVPFTVIANGLFGAFVVMNTLPLVWNPVKMSFVGENEMLMAHDAPGAMDDGQLLVAE